MTCAPSEDSNQPAHLPSLIRVFTVHSMGSQGPKNSSCGQRRLWSDWADAQTDLHCLWQHRSFCWFCRAAAQILCHRHNISTKLSHNIVRLIILTFVIYCPSSVGISNDIRLQYDGNNPNSLQYFSFMSMADYFFKTIEFCCHGDLFLWQHQLLWISGASVIWLSWQHSCDFYTKCLHSEKIRSATLHISPWMRKNSDF